MQVVSKEFISGKKVLLRLDLDVPLKCKVSEVAEDFRLKTGLPTLKLCLNNATLVTVVGHLGRPGGKVIPELSVKPVVEWLRKGLGELGELGEDRLKFLENLRFDAREDQGDLGFAKELAQLGEIYINEAFAAHHPAASTTILPTLLPHAAGLRLAEEVRVLQAVRENPERPLVAIIGGVKVEDKYPAILALAQFCDAVLVGGKLVSEITQLKTAVARNVMVGMLNETGLDLASSTIDSYMAVIKNARQVIWAGPIGKVQSSKFEVQNLGSEKGNYEIAQTILASGAEFVVGGGDTIAALDRMGLLEAFQKNGFISTGGGAMLKLLTDGTLQTIEALR